MLGFEPPHYDATATLGGTLASGLSGPRRPYAGAARDFVLGTCIVNGKGEILRFGGQVVKNVAGFDVSRFMVGARGALGVILEASLKVLPKPASELTPAFEMDAGSAIARMNAWAGRPLPLSAACHSGETLYIRLSGAGSAVRAAHTKLGGEPVADGERYWLELREHRRLFFAGREPLWRLSVPAAAPMLGLSGKWKLDWGGAQRWLKSGAPAEQIRKAAAAAGGYAMLFRASDADRREAHAPGLPDVCAASLRASRRRESPPCSNEYVPAEPQHKCSSGTGVSSKPRSRRIFATVPFSFWPCCSVHGD